MSRSQLIQITLESIADWDVDIADIIESYINNLEQENAQLKKHNEELQHYNVGLAESEFSLKQECEKLKAEVEALRPYRDNHIDLLNHMAKRDAEVIEQFSSDLSTITNEMKIECIGEFSWKEDADYYDEDGEYVDYVATREVPWDLCKNIYKQMLSVKLRQKAQGNSK